MRRIFLSLIFSSGLFFLYPLNLANAQYKHHGLGFLAGIQNTFNQGGDPNAEPKGGRANLGYNVGISYISLGFEYNLRFEDNWMFTVESHFSIHSCGTPSATESNAVCGGEYRTPIMFAAVTGIRYLFLTDEIRPYIDLGIGFWQSIALVRTGITSFGPTLTGGFEYFFMEELSLGLRLRYGLQLTIDSAQIVPFHQLMVLATFNAYL